MAILLLENEIIALKQKEAEVVKRLNSASDDQKAFIQKILDAIRGWIKEFEETIKVLEAAYEVPF